MATKIYTLNDRISLEIGELVFKLAPMTYKQKIEVRTLLTQGTGLEGVVKAVKYTLKDVSDITNKDGSKYELQFENDELTDKCLDDILNLEDAQKLQTVCLKFLEGVPKELDIEGVKLVSL